MLVEIRSDRLRVGAIRFHSGLNVVLGDENATNSIGKSSLLMLVDFAFGGSDLLVHHADAVQELGHHDYFVTFEFEGELYRFRRGTFRPELVYPCSETYLSSEPIDLEAYTAFLKSSYRTAKDISFRSLVGLYSRIWGKDNLTVSKPLHIVQAQPGKECIVNLIKTYGRYDEIGELEAKLQTLGQESTAFQKAFETKILPKVNHVQYQLNEQTIQAVEREIGDIKENLAKYSMSISEIANRETLELKLQKDRLLELKLQLESKLQRVHDNLSNNRHIKSKHFEGLTRFFPEVNQDRLAQVEEFHSELAKILRDELRQSESELKERTDAVTAEVAAIDRRIAASLSRLDSPDVIVDRVFDLAGRLQVAQEENRYRDISEEVRQSKKQTQKDLSARKVETLKWLEDFLNDTLRRLVTEVFGPDRKSPEIKLSESNYKYQVFEDTGTGTAYASLIVFDLAVFSTSTLPIVIHDSLLFKNIENDSVSNLLGVYDATSKQSFIAIDEAQKYGPDAAKLLHDQRVVQLDDNNVLFIKDWRRK
jgi:hypothetical protein